MPYKNLPEKRLGDAFGKISFNALIASFLAFGGAVDEATLQRIGSNLRALIYDPESRLSSATNRILEDILVGIDHE